jgi:hypothetical protein
MLLDSLNKDTAPEGAPVTGGEKEAKFLKEMNAFEDDHERFMDSLKEPHKSISDSGTNLTR